MRIEETTSSTTKSSIPSSIEVTGEASITPGEASSPSAKHIQSDKEGQGMLPSIARILHRDHKEDKDKDKLISMDEHKDEAEGKEDKVESDSILLYRFKKALGDLEEKEVMNKMPSCAEKSLLLSLRDTLLHSIADKESKLNLTADRRSVDARILLQKEAILAEIDRLLAHLKKEGHSQSNAMSLVVRAKAKIDSLDWKGGYDLLVKAQKELRAFGIQKFLSLVRKTENAAQQIEGEAVILLLGGTGAGKSTTIHFLAGSTMIKVGSHIQPDPRSIPHGSPLEQVRTSDDVISETRYITAVPVEYDDGGDKRRVILCDTPGFDDTSGPEVDAANGVGIIKAIKKCNQVKPLILGSQFSIGDRGEGLRKLVKIIVGMFSGIDKKLLKSFSYGFTKYEGTQSKKIPEFLKKIKLDQSSEEKDDKAFANIINDMSWKTRNGAKVIDPLKDKRTDYFDELFHEEWIENPAGVFQFFITPSTKSVINEQVDKHKLNIISALDRYDYDFVKYKIDELAGLYGVLGYDFIKRALDDSVQLVIKHMETIYTEANNLLARVMEDGNVLKEADLTTYKTYLGRAELVEKLFLPAPDAAVLENPFEGNIARKAVYIEALQNGVDALQRAISRDLNSKEMKGAFSSDLEVKDVSSPTASKGIADQSQRIALVTSRLDKIKLVANQFQSSQLIATYRNANALMKDWFDGLVKNTKLAIDSNDFMKAAELLGQIQQFSLRLKEHLNVQETQKEYENITKGYFIDHLNKIIKNTEELLRKETLDEENMKSINNFLTIMKSAEGAQALHSHIPIKTIQEMDEYLLKKTVDYFEEVRKKVEGRLDNIIAQSKPGISQSSASRQSLVTPPSKSYDSKDEKSGSVAKDNPLKEIKPLMDQMTLMRTVILRLEPKTASSYYKTVEKLNGYVNALETKIKSILNDILEEKPGADSNPLVDTLVILKNNAQWIDAIKPGTCQGVIDEVNDAILGFAKKLVNTAKKISLRVEEHKNLPRIKKMLEQFEALKPLEAKMTKEKEGPACIEGLGACRSELEQWFDGQVQPRFKNCKEYGMEEKSKEEKLASLPSSRSIYGKLQVGYAENMFCYLNECKDIARSSSGAEDAYSSLESYITQQVTNAVSEINQCLSDITNYSGISSEKSKPGKDSDKPGSQGIKKLNENIEIICNYLEELKNFSVNSKMYPNLAKCLDSTSIIAKLSKRLDVIFNDLFQETATELGRVVSAKMPDYLAILRVLGRLDNYFDKPEQYKFCVLLRQCAQKNAKTDHLSTALTAIEKHNYVEVARIMSVLALRPDDDAFQADYNKIKEELSTSLESLIDSAYTKTIGLARSMDFEKVNLVIRDLRYIDDAQLRLGKQKHINESTQIKLEKMKAEIAKAIANYMDQFLKGVSAAIQNWDFADAETKITSIDQICATLGTLSDKSLSQPVTSLKESKDVKEKELTISEKIEKLKSSLDEKLEEEVNVYINTGLDQYSFKPPREMLSRLNAVSAFNPRYTRAYTKLRDGIFNKFRAEQKAIADAKNPDVRTQKIRVYEVALRALPTEMNGLGEELNFIKEDIKNREQQARKTVETVLNATSIDSSALVSIKERIEEYRKDGGRHLEIMEIEDKLSQKVENIREQLTRQFDERAIDEKTLKSIKMIMEYKYHFNTVPGIVNVFGDVKRRLKEIFESETGLLIGQSKASVDDDASLESKKVTRAAESLDILALLKKFRSEFDTSTSPYLKDYTAILPADFDTKVKQVYDDLVDFFSETQKQFDNNLKTCKVPDLKKNLQVKEKWEGIRQKLRHHLQESKDLERCKPFTDVTQDLSNFVKSIAVRVSTISLADYAKNRTELEKDRIERYKKLNNELGLLRQMKELKKYLVGSILDIDKIDSEYIKRLEGQILNIIVECERLGNEINTGVSGQMTRRQVLADCEKFDFYYNQLVSARDYLTQLESIDVTRINRLSEIFNGVIKNAISVADQKSCDVAKLAKCLSGAKTIADTISSVKKLMGEGINEVLKTYKEKQVDAAAIGKLGVLLESDASGAVLIDEYPEYFKGYSTYLFNEKTLKQGIDYVLKEIKGDGIDSEMLASLKENYDQCVSHYNEVVRKYLRADGAAIKGVDLDQLSTETIDFAGPPDEEDFAKRIAHGVKVIFTDFLYGTTDDKISLWGPSMAAKIPKLMAKVFAMWTLRNAKHYFQNGQGDNYLQRPHAAQIIGIFRMLGMGDKSYDLKNNLVQIGTGEGKSVTLAVTASVLALLGFDVNCACYSDYLSQRDFKMFEDMFDKLGITKHIHYGTFNQLSERVINETGSIRTKVESLIYGLPMQKPSDATLSRRHKILLIDEVDVFFSKDFFGNLYTPSVSLKHETITVLIKYIWDNRKNRTSLGLEEIRKREEYQACCKKFAEWKELIDEAVKDMLASVKNYEHDYVVHNDRIMYKEQDALTDTVGYGYKTLFAYFHEHDLKNITHASLLDHISIPIRCGNFSYAEIPHPPQFKRIMGVTGTLQSLSEEQKGIIKGGYKIEKSTFCPSVFGKNQLKFAEESDIQILEDSDYYIQIVEEIKRRLLVPSKDDCKRAVLVFFETKKKLMEFYESDAVASIRNGINIMTEGLSIVEKDRLIKLATSEGKITLLTKSFGRGTDFVCRDKNVASNGGVHVIQAFVSEELSEETQIKGRAARQGEQGSYSMLLRAKDLEKFLITKEEIEEARKTNNTYPLINAKRNAFFAQQYKNSSQYVTEVKKDHEDAKKFLARVQDISNGTDRPRNLLLVKEFLCKLNKGPIEKISSKTICLLDGTASMTLLLQNAKNTVGTMFERATAVLAEQKIDAGSFKMQFAAYRNYNAPADKLLQVSSWETRPENLRAFLATVNAEYGWGDEAIEIGLWHVNREADAADAGKSERVTQVILIGDAPANTPEEVIARRGDKQAGQGEDYWRTTALFATPAQLKPEMEKLKRRNIPVHCFFVDRLAQSDFKRIAKETSGVCEELDINSSRGAERLIEVVTKQILKDGVDEKEAEKRIAIYNKKFHSGS